MSPLPPVTAIIRDARRLVRRYAGLAIAAALLTLAPAVLIVAWLLAGWPGWTSPSAAPLVIDVLVLLLGATFLVLAIRALRRQTTERAVAGSAEAGAGLPRGTVSGVLELARGVPRGTSVALFERTERALSSKFAGRKAAEVSGETGRVARRQFRRALAGLVVAIGVAVGLALLSPERSRAGWPALFQPLSHLSGPLLPALEVEPGDADVPRGDELEVRIRAAGRFAVTVRHRAEGDVPRSETVTVVGDSASVRFPVDARTVYQVTAPDGAASPEFVATPLDPLLVSELVVEVRYPSHAGRLPERYETEVPPIEVPEGTTLAVTGRATLRLDAAALVGGSAVVPLAVDGSRFSATWTPTASALYVWRLESRQAGAPGALPPPLDVSVVPDAPPSVEMTFPATDTILDATRVQPLAADAEDDFGISAATLVWRIVRNGRTGAPMETPVPFDSTGSRVFIRGVLDARDLDLLPGDTIRYLVRVVDNGPRQQTATTAEYALYLPGRPEMRERAEDQLAQAVEETRNLSQETRALQDATRDLQRRTRAAQAQKQTNAQGGSGQQGSLGFQETEQARQVLEQQRELAARLEEMRQRLEAMENDLANAALRDPKLEQQLKELRQLYDQMLNPELHQQVQQLQDALDKLDPQELEKALEELAARQQQIREQLQQSLDQLRRAATQEQINALAQEARELATQQAALADAQEKGEAGADAAAQQRQMEAKAGELQRSVSEVSDELQRQQEQQAATSSQSAGDAIERARQQMQNAADRTANRTDAAAEGRQAAQNLEQAAQSLDAARGAMAQSDEQRASQAMQQARRDAEELARRQEDLRKQMEEQARQQQAQGQQQNQQGQQQGQQAGGAGEAMQQLRDQQSALQQEMSRLSQNLAQTSDQTGQVSREVGAEMGRANASMQRTTQAMQQAGEQQQGMPTREAGQTVESLQRLAQALQRNVQMLQQGEQGSASDQARQQLDDIAQQQGQLNGRTNALLPLRLNPQSMAQQTGRMAQDQRQIARQIEQLGEKGASKDDVLGRLDEMAREAERLARALEGGRPPAEVLSRQERLFHRLLDAGRSLEKEEMSQKRVGEAPGVWTPSSPKALDPTLLDTGDRYRLPTAEELRALPPAYRRMVLDYFGRINRAGATGGSGGR